jgi:hypothetical protein
MDVEIVNGFERLLLPGRAGSGSLVSNLAVTAGLANATQSLVWSLAEAK